tara:strand:- start:869 stop:1570 length:702 start_codon:yes stop_codon:yes gene_type:complete
MLRFDMSGKLIEPSRLKKTIGGNIDRDGLPAKIDIPTTDDWTGVTIADNVDGALGKVLSRTTLGKIAVRNSQANLITSNVEALHLKARVIGGGSNATSGQTTRRFRFGFIHPTVGNEGAYVEYLPPAYGELEGSSMVGIAGNVKTRKPINYTVNNPGEHYALDLWVSYNRADSRWYITLMEGEQVRTQYPFSSTELSLYNRYLIPFIEWEWEDASGAIDVTVCQFEHTVYWRF